MKWNNPIMVNGKTYANSDEAFNDLKDFKGAIEISLNFSESAKPEKKAFDDPIIDTTEYRIQVKKYMTEKSTSTFDFMKKWNNDIPMPFVVMYGTIIDETKGMYKMKLQGKMESSTSNCTHCGRELKNIVSRNYGIGPICGKHLNIAPPETIEEFKRREEEIRKAIESVQWEGWVIKSAIKEKSVIKKEKKEDIA